MTATLEDLKKRVDQIEKELLRKHAPNKDCLTIEEVAAWIGCTTDTVKRLTDQGKLTAEFKNSNRKYLRSDIELYLRGFEPGKKGKKKQQAKA